MQYYTDLLLCFQNSHSAGDRQLKNTYLHDGKPECIDFQEEYILGCLFKMLCIDPILSPCKSNIHALPCCL